MRLIRRCLQDRVRAVTAGQPSDAGFSLLLVIGFTAMVAALVAVSTATGVRALRSSAEHVDFEGALSVTEAGVDASLNEISTTFNNSGTDTWASACTFPAPSEAQRADKDLERAYVRDQLVALAADPTCRTVTAKGEHVAVRPATTNTVYSMGWYPSYSAPRASRRLLKAEYIFAPYKPSNALLTAGTLDFSGSVAVQSAVASVPANVHTNGSITSVNNSVSIQGSLSMSGDGLPGCPAGITGGCADEEPLQTIPTISARKTWNSQANSPLYSSTWFDLCPDGTMRKPNGTVNGARVPCVTGSGPGEVAATPYATTNGWQFTPGTASVAPKWTLPRTAGGPYPGAYYVYRGDAIIGDNGHSTTVWPISVLAEANPSGGSSTTCGKLGGNITWKLFNLTPHVQGLQLLADANLYGSANADAGSGLFFAGDKIDINTSSSTITGALVAGNYCAAQGPNTVQGVTISFDDMTESPVMDVIRTTLWLEYGAG